MSFFQSFLVVLVLAVSLLYLVFKNFYSYWKNRGIPHEPPTLLYGNASKQMNKTVSLTDVLQGMYQKFKGESQFFGFYLFIRPLAVITDLDLIKNILIRDFNYFTDRGLYYNARDDPLSAHLFSVDGPEWRFMRTKLTPTFTSGKMKFMFPTILKVGNEFEEVFSKMVETEPELEIKELLARFSTDVIGTCAFGIECNSLKDPNAEFRIRGRDIFRKQRIGPMQRAIMETFPNVARFLRMKVATEETSQFFLNVVKETAEYREKNNVRRNDFMDLLLEVKNSDKDGSGLTMGQMAAQSFVFFIAGFETSSTTMGYCLYELAKNQEIQDKLKAEIEEVLKKYDGDFTYEAMNEMTYMEQVINETLRMYPPVPILFRKAIKNYQVPGTKVVIEKGTGVFIPNYAIQHDPQIFPNPERFDPDRFSPEQIKNRHPCASLPFGDGPRNCIGLRFGKMQTRVGLVTLLKKFKFSVCDSTQIPLRFDKKNFILGPESGINLKVEKNR